MTSDDDSPAPRTELDYLSVRLAVAVGRLNRRIRPSRDGLSHGLLSALSTVVRVGPLRPGDLGRLEVVAPPTVTRAIAELERRGLTERSADPADGRSFFVQATTAGVDLVLRARSERAERTAALLAELGENDIEKLSHALDALEAAATSNPRLPVPAPTP